MLSQQLAFRLLRWSLGVIFLWFGILKLFNVSPVLELIKQSLPPMLGESQLFLFILSLAEILIGVALLVNRFVAIAVIVMIVHLFLASIAVLISAGFDPRFPILSLEGEFVLKNLTLIAAGLILLTKPQQPSEHKEPSEKK